MMAWKHCFLIGLYLVLAQSFTAVSVVRSLHDCSPSATTPQFHQTSLLARRGRHSDDDGKDSLPPSSSTKIPQLPPIGDTSFSHRSAVGVNGFAAPAESQDTTAFVSPKFELRYTCKVCEARNSHMVSRVAYREGVVIAICKGCKSKHLIADNLGTSGMLDDGQDASKNIEEYFTARGMEDSVNRVNAEVFQLEKILDLPGTFVDDNGNPVLE